MRVATVGCPVGVPEGSQRSMNGWPKQRQSFCRRPSIGCCRACRARPTPPDLADRAGQTRQRERRGESRVPRLTHFPVSSARRGAAWPVVAQSVSVPRGATIAGPLPHKSDPVIGPYFILGSPGIGFGLECARSSSAWATACSASLSSDSDSSGGCWRCWRCCCCCLCCRRGVLGAAGATADDFLPNMKDERCVDEPERRTLIPSPRRPPRRQASRGRSDGVASGDHGVQRVNSGRRRQHYIAPSRR